MPTPTDLQEPTVQTLAQRHGFSVEAVRCMQAAVVAGVGSLASFEHAEFGGPGQWMRGGLLMLSDPLDHELRARVDALCYDLGDLVPQPQVEPTPHIGILPACAATPRPWWPGELGTPNATGQQNGRHYAYFADRRRLALKDNGQVRVHDTGEHRISGIAQQQSDGHGTLCFTSQYGTVTIEDLPAVADHDADAQPRADVSSPATPDLAASSPAHGVLDAIDRLGNLKARGHLTDEEFEAAKQSLLVRL